MSIEKKILKKKLEDLEDRMPGIDTSQIERELYPIDDTMYIKVGKRKKSSSVDE